MNRKDRNLMKLLVRNSSRQLSRRFPVCPSHHFDSDVEADAAHLADGLMIWHQVPQAFDQKLANHSGRRHELLVGDDFQHGQTDAAGNWITSELQAKVVNC